ncbi:MAG: hypothetical protein KAH12_04780 [Anaerolineales bacterium]|nr:hypothetical protein [Anaerolineales bacterium]
MKTLKLIVGILAVLVSTSLILQAGTICVTFERLPFMEPLVYWTPRELSNLVLNELEKRNIRSIGFVQEEKLTDTPSSGIVLLDWAEKGHLLGNNTFSYVDFNELTVKEFLEHVADGQKSILRASRTSGNNFRYIRFPTMHYGNTEGKRSKISSVLFKNGYTVFPATVIPYDWEFNWVYRDYAENEKALKILRTMYKEYIFKCLEYAEKQSLQVFNKEITQVIRLHLGIATAQFLPDILDELENRGYTFISPEKVLADEVFETEDCYYGPLGLSFTERIAASRAIEFDPDYWEIDRKNIRKALSRQLEEDDQPPSN